MAINRDKILQEAQKLVEKKRYDKAIAEYQKVVADDPNDVRTLLKVGDLYLKMQQFAEAIATYDRVATYYSVQGFSVKAVAVYKQIREIIQKHAPHLEDRFGHVVPKLAELLTQLDLRSDALAYYDEMATRLQTVGRDRDAIDVFRKIVGLDPQNPVSHLRLADAYTRVRDFDGATQEFAIASEILLRIGRRDDAFRVVERILQYRQEPRFAKLAAEILLDRGAPNDAMGALTKLQIAFKANPRDLETLGLLARAFDGLQQSSKALEVQKEAARIARSENQLDACEQIVADLLRRAPNDTDVIQLVASLRGESKSAPPPSVAASGYPSMGGPVQQPAARAATPEAPPVARREQPPPPAAVAARPPVEDEREPVSVVEEISSAELMMDDIDIAFEGDEAAASEDEPPFALRSSPPGGDDAASRVREIVSRSETFRRNGDYQAAISALRVAIAQHPSVREVRERLCDVLIECGDQDAAVLEMLAYARHVIEVGDSDAAARLLDEVLLLEPDNRTALQLLGSLGYAVSTPDEEPAPSQAQGWAQPDAHDPSAPLPSYDLEDAATGDAQQLLARGHSVAPTSARLAAPPIELDDPFASENTSFGMPAYPLEEPAQERVGSSPGTLDEAALEEIEFFTQHGMLEEAEGLLGEQLARLPNNPLLLEKRREIEAARSAAAGEDAATRLASPYAEAPAADVAAGEYGYPPPSLSEAPASSAQAREVTVDRAYDIAHALDEMDNVLDNFGPRQQPHTIGQQVSVEAVFEQFKQGVAAQIAESDAATHYDLGVAYKEMGLIADAIHEFELASRDPTRECVCQSMIGMLHMQNNNIEGAIDAFILGLHAVQKTVDQELALTYEIGNAYEMRSNTDQALYYFQLVARLDLSYRDPRGSVAERIAMLERRSGHEPVAPKSIAVGDEFDAAFDDLFNPKG